ncbi:MAG: hypothetical protein Q9165_001116 [Trypethelium subeluteriae]
MPFKLLNLPTELILNTIEHLDPPELYNIRLACSTLESLCSHEFRKQCFRYRTFMVTRPSLEAFVGLSQRLGGNLDYIGIGTNAFTYAGLDRLAGVFLSDEANAKFHQVKLDKYAQLVEDQEYFLESGMATHLLTHALEGLASYGCIHIRACDPDGVAYDGGDSVYDDDGEATLQYTRGWGWTKIRDEMGFLCPGCGVEVMLQKIVTIVLASIAASKAAIREFRFSVYRHHDVNGILIKTIRLPPIQLEQL